MRHALSPRALMNPASARGTRATLAVVTQCQQYTEKVMRELTQKFARTFANFWESLHSRITHFFEKCELFRKFNFLVYTSHTDFRQSLHSYNSGLTEVYTCQRTGSSPLQPETRKSFKNPKPPRGSSRSDSLVTLVTLDPRRRSDASTPK